MKMHLPLAVAVGAALPLFAWAQDASVAPRPGSEKRGAAGAKIGQMLLTRYLDAVKGKQWGEAKQLLHPQTLAVIAERKKRLGREEHPMAPWHDEKEYYLKAYRLVGTRHAASAFVVDVSEDNYQVREHVVVENEPAAYLVGKFHGKWYVVDKKRGEGFSDESIKLGYPGYFDKLQFPREVEEERRCTGSAAIRAAGARTSPAARES